jgi:hypothetical protein
MFFVSVPLLGCLGWGDIFAPRRPIAGDYFLMEGDENTTKDLYLLIRHNPLALLVDSIELGGISSTSSTRTTTGRLSGTSLP